MIDKKYYNKILLWLFLGWIFNIIMVITMTFDNDYALNKAVKHIIVFDSLQYVVAGLIVSTLRKPD